MKYRIEVKRSAAKAFKKISKPDQKIISKAIDNLAENLPNPDTTKMKGNNPFHKIRVGDYRVVYETQDDILFFGKPMFPIGWLPAAVHYSQYQNVIILNAIKNSVGKASGEATSNVFINHTI